MFASLRTNYRHIIAIFITISVVSSTVLAQEQRLYDDDYIRDQLYYDYFESPYEYSKEQRSLKYKKYDHRNHTTNNKVYIQPLYFD